MRVSGEEEGWRAAARHTRDDAHQVVRHRGWEEHDRDEVRDERHDVVRAQRVHL